MLLNALDIKILIAGYQYLQKRGRLTKTMAHRIKMIEADVNEHYGKSFLPSKARLKQMFHMMNELALIDRYAFIRPMTQIGNFLEYERMMNYYKKNTRFNHGDFPLIIREHANEFYEKLREWFFKQESIDGQMRHVQEITTNLRIQE